MAHWARNLALERRLSSVCVHEPVCLFRLHANTPSGCGIRTWPNIGIDGARVLGITSRPT